MSESSEILENQASLLSRAFAILIDWLACIVVVTASGRYEWGDPSMSYIVLAVFAAEYTFFVWMIGGSFGHIVVGLRVINSRMGGRVRLFACVIRTVLLCLVIPAILFDNQSRGFHDRISATCVVKK